MTTDTTMKAIGFTQSLPIEAQDSLFEFEAPYPHPMAHDLIVKVSAISINPVDAKVRTRAAKDKVLETPRIVGYDAVGTVVALGESVEDFSVGDRVYYAGDINRPGSNAEFQAVDSRIVAKTPTRLTYAEAAALPLTALTGWETLFDRLRIDPAAKNKTLLIIGGAGGVGSISIQIAKQLTHLTVIATASRPESEAWVKSMGADYVANHKNLTQSVKELGFEHVDYIFNTADSLGHWDAMVELIAPQGMIASIVEFNGSVNISQLQSKSAGFVWELMFTRSLYKTDDMIQQQIILQKLAKLVDEGRIKTTLTSSLQGFTIDHFKEAHRRIESGKTLGKIAISF
ncbi:zinc-binding alcohol dehydrogenase family protein [Zooshikella harenae]|uniref:Zinc-type alcohol dehydrogenase-like protein n=1 Tax=Zooshikella harenae TaxID=2827238 RepID=A0ABS5ZDP7_9GAMM|nr:zinc-binding alcohol dehydrogenase family protein [Zooshikella harenae]MBU2711072.1 zinc-binding alcohol dehydrogenase family protein [Zooshikella harenae]